MDQNRKSQMEKAEGSREKVRGSASGSSGSTSGRSSTIGERLRETERMRGSGGITNRELEREQREQEELPERGRSQSER